jgi:3-methyl-2-oxobutanoate hydroxymethyltransferase
MNKKYKRVFSINLQPGYRNYTVKDLQDLKGKKKLTQILVSNASEASAAEEAGIDLILAKPDENVPLIRKAASKTFMTVAIPFIKYSSKEKIVKKALELVELGADSIHCGSWNLNFMKYLNEFKIPFQGHAGLVPRRSTWIGGVRAFGKNSSEALKLLSDIKDIEDTGAWGVEVECVPEDILGEITKETKLLTLSIGSGKRSDVQFLFAEDILGCSSIDTPRHAKMYANFNKLNAEIQKERIKAFKKFASEVKNGTFPSKKHSIPIENNELNNFKKLLRSKKYN